MPCKTEAEYVGNNDPNRLLNEYSRIVDVAVLDSDEITAPKVLDAHVISLDGIDISLDKFLNMFYHVDNKTFQMNKAMAEDPDMTFVGQRVHTNNFHLPESVIRLYGIDLGVELSQLDPCSSMEIDQQVLRYKSLANMCSVKCALTFNEIIETIVNRTESSIPQNDSTWGTVFGTAQTIDDSQFVTSAKPVSHQLVINSRFYNANPAVRDIIVKFRYNVSFAGETKVTDIIKSQIRPYFTSESSASGIGSSSA